MTGLILMNLLGDLKGKKFSMITGLALNCIGMTCNIIIILVNTIGAFTVNIPLLLIAQVTCGIGATSLTIIAYVLAR